VSVGLGESFFLRTVNLSRVTGYIENNIEVKLTRESFLLAPCLFLYSISHGMALTVAGLAVSNKGGDLLPIPLTAEAPEEEQQSVHHERPYYKPVFLHSSILRL